MGIMCLFLLPNKLFSDTRNKKVVRAICNYSILCDDTNRLEVISSRHYNAKSKWKNVDSGKEKPHGRSFHLKEWFKQDGELKFKRIRGCPSYTALVLNHGKQQQKCILALKVFLQNFYQPRAAWSYDGWFSGVRQTSFWSSKLFLGTISLSLKPPKPPIHTPNLPNLAFSPFQAIYII